MQIKMRRSPRFPTLLWVAYDRSRPSRPLMSSLGLGRRQNAVVNVPQAATDLLLSDQALTFVKRGSNFPYLS